MLLPASLGVRMYLMKPPTKTLRALCPIYGLTSWIISNVKLGSNIVLRDVDMETESKEIADVGLRSIGYRCLLEITQEYDPSDYSDDPWVKIQDIALSVEAALRIYHEGKIGVAAVIYYQDNQYQSAYIMNSSVPNGQEDYKIDKAALAQFPSFFSNFEAAYKQKPVALQYFSRAQQRFNKNDISIDLCTSLESIFVPANSRGAKKVFLTQGVKILGFSGDEAQMISDLYEFRNTVIHGDHAQRVAIYAKKKGNYTMSWFETCENLVRAILQKYVEKPW